MKYTSLLLLIACGYCFAATDCRIDEPKPRQGVQSAVELSNGERCSIDGEPIRSGACLQMISLVSSFRIVTFSLDVATGEATRSSYTHPRSGPDKISKLQKIRLSPEQIEQYNCLAYKVWTHPHRTREQFIEERKRKEEELRKQGELEAKLASERENEKIKADCINAKEGYETCMRNTPEVVVAEDIGKFPDDFYRYSESDLVDTVFDVSEQLTLIDEKEAKNVGGGHSSKLAREAADLRQFIVGLFTNE